jgi:UDP-glucuronate decarboxylase
MCSIKILITGGAGNIGGSLARHLSSKSEYEVCIVDNLQTGSIAKLPSSDRCRFIRADVNLYADLAPIITSLQPDYVFH